MTKVGLTRHRKHIIPSPTGPMKTVVSQQTPKTQDTKPLNTACSSMGSKHVSKVNTENNIDIEVNP
jgi:hypothetical protein